jgi:hypothetical protein
MGEGAEGTTKHKNALKFNTPILTPEKFANLLGMGK